MKKPVLAILCTVLALSASTAIAPAPARAAPGDYDQNDVNDAVVRAIQYLHPLQNANGSFGSSYPGAETGFALAAYGGLANEPTLANQVPGYASDVRDAVNFLVNNQNGDGSWSLDGLSTYDTGIALMGLSPYQNPTAAVVLPPALQANLASAILSGRTWLLDAIQDEVPGQPNTPCSSANGGLGSEYCGGWNYDEDKGRSDQSNTGFALTGLELTPGGVPAAVAALNIGWQNHVQAISSNPFAGPRDDGGGSYQPQYVPLTNEVSSNANNSGSLLFGLAFDGVPASNTNAAAAIAFTEGTIDQYELMTTTSAPRTMIHHTGNNPPVTCVIGAPGCKWELGTDGGYHYSLFALSKGLGSYQPAVLSNPTNWYAKVVDLLLGEQRNDGSWPVDGRNDATNLVATALSVSTLEQVGQTSTRLTETASTSSAHAPFTVTFTYLETNTGGTPIRDVAVSGSSCGPATYSSGDVNGNGVLDPGETWVFTCTRVFPSAVTITDEAMATGTNVNNHRPAPIERTHVKIKLSPERGTIKVCKVAGPGVAIGEDFTFEVGGAVSTVPAGPPPGGYCKVVGSFPVGSNVTVRETGFPSKSHVARIAVSPKDQIVGKPDLDARAVLVTVGSGITEVSYTNNRTGYVEICKKTTGPGVTGDFQFSFDGQTQTIPVGSCGPAVEVPFGSLTITETVHPGTKLVGCATVRPGDLIQCTLASQSATVKIRAGSVSSQTVITFTNRRKGG